MARNSRSSRRKSLRAPAAPVLKLELQRATGDCGIACVATITGAAYEDVLLEAGREKRVGKNPHKSGLYLSNIRRIAKRLGCPLRLKMKCDFEKDQGILAIRWKTGISQNHVVVLTNGLIFDMSDATVWEPEDYRKANKAVFNQILVPAV